MKKTPPKPEFTEAELVRNLRGDRSFRAFEAYLNERIPTGAPGATTHQSPWNWENDIHPVNNASIWAWKTYYSEGDPRHQLALDITALRHKYEPEFNLSDKKKLAGQAIPRIQVQIKAQREKVKAAA